MADLNLQLVLRFIDRATRPARAALRQMEQTGQAMERTGRERAALARGQTMAAVGQAAAVGAALYSAIRPAMEMETRMAEISKVVDFDPTGLKELQKGIFDLNTTGGIPMAAAGIADIIAAAGQAGVVDKALPDDEERRRLLAFAADAARMGVAFDMTGDQAGNAMAGWRKKMGLAQEQTIALADAVNHLSNNMNATAPAIVDVIGRQGALAMAAGLTEIEVAALSAAFVQAAPSPEIAATAMKNFTGALTAGEAMTKRQSAVLRELGFDAEDLALRMQEDARGAILDVMQALKELPEEKRASAVRQLFGEESAGAIAPLLQNLDALAEAFEMVADKESYAGSMMDEFLKMSGTTEAKITQLKSNLDKLRTNTGGTILPEFKAFVEWLGPAIGGIADWVGENGGIVKAVLGGAGALAAINLVSKALKWLFWDTVRIGGRLLIFLSRLAGPWGLLAAAIAGAAWYIYDNWDEVIALLQPKVDALLASMERAGLINVGGKTAKGNAIPLKKVLINGQNVGQTAGMTPEQWHYPFSPYYKGDKRPFQFNGATATPPEQKTTINNRTEVNVGGIVIHQQPGEANDALARRVAENLRDLERNDSALHDGGSYD